MRNSILVIHNLNIKILDKLKVSWKEKKVSVLKVGYKHGPSDSQTWLMNAGLKAIPRNGAMAQWLKALSAIPEDLFGS